MLYNYVSLPYKYVYMRTWGTPMSPMFNKSLLLDTSQFRDNSAESSENSAL